jgi:predicted PurR-regulated permease PerM
MKITADFYTIIYMENQKSFSKKSLTFISFAILAFIIIFMLKETVQILLLVFTAVLLAVFLRGLAGLVKKVINVRQNPALIIAIAGLILLSAILVFLLGPVVSSGFADLEKEIPTAISSLEKRIYEYSWGENLVNEIKKAAKEYAQNEEFRTQIFGVFSSIFSVLTGILIVLVIGLYAAFNPGEYSNGFVKLFPKEKRKRVNEILGKLENALLWWMVGQFSAMAVVGILITIGLLFLNVPLAIPLGFLAAALAFIPNLGPILSAIPAVAMGFIESPQKALYVILLYMGVQIVESYLITPQIQKKAVSISPALLLTVQLIIGTLLGIFGLILATPLMVVIIVVIQTVYVQDVLKDDVEVLGE